MEMRTTREENNTSSNAVSCYRRVLGHFRPQRLWIGTGAKQSSDVHLLSGANIKRPMRHHVSGALRGHFTYHETSGATPQSRSTPLDSRSSLLAAMPRGRPPFPPPTGEYSDHAANCHCGRVKFTFSISPPLGEYPVVVCNCSICQRNGYLLVYPTKDKVKLQEGSEEGVGSYTFANKNVKHNFCKECGSSVFFEVLNPPQEAVTEAEGRGETLPVIMGVNVSSVAFSTSAFYYLPSLWLIY